MSDPAAPIAPEIVPVAAEPVILTADEQATQEAAGGAPGTVVEPAAVEPIAVPEPGSREDVAMKAYLRRNIRWLMAEIDHVREGRGEEERAALNP